MVGRHIDEMPARASIDFEVDWQNHLSLYINFRTDKLNSYSACNGYCLRLAQTYVYLYRYTLVNGRGLSRRLGQRISINLTSLLHFLLFLLFLPLVSRTYRSC